MRAISASLSVPTKLARAIGFAALLGLCGLASVSWAADSLYTLGMRQSSVGLSFSEGSNEQLRRVATLTGVVPKTELLLGVGDFKGVRLESGVFTRPAAPAQLFVAASQEWRLPRRFGAIALTGELRSGGAGLDAAWRMGSGGRFGELGMGYSMQQLPGLSGGAKSFFSTSYAYRLSPGLKLQVQLAKDLSRGYADTGAAAYSASVGLSLRY